MTAALEKKSNPSPSGDEAARVEAYALSPKGRASIERAQRDIEEGRGIPGDDAYFSGLKRRRAATRGAS